MGRVVRQYQRTNSVNYLVEATYNLGSTMATETYPSVPGASDRRSVSFSYDNAGRLSSLSSSATSYAPAASVSSIGYSSQNALSTETYGNSLIHAVSYNNRLQPTEIKLGTSSNSTSVLDLNYSYGTTSNNGNIQSYTYSGGGLSYTQSFSYDSLNRLSVATETNGGSTNWSQTNAYDRYGNRQIDYGGGSYNLAFSSSTNRITTSGFSYDSAGNLTNDTIHTYAFDGNEKIKSVDSTTAYTYDGEGQRVRKLVGENTRFVYGIGGELLGEYDGSSGNLKKEYVSGGITIEPTAVNSNGTQYVSADHLSSPRVITNSSGSVVSRHDYMPFGEELSSGTGGRTTGMGFSGSGDNNRKKFTGYQRDTESGLDFAQTRYYGNTQGRFTSPDPFSGSATIADPQTFNRYAYCRNNPVTSVDPSGMVPTTGALFSMPTGDGMRNSMSPQYHDTWQQVVADITPTSVEDAVAAANSSASLSSAILMNADGTPLPAGSVEESALGDPQNAGTECNCTLAVRGHSGDPLTRGDSLRFPGRRQKLGYSSTIWDRYGWQVEVVASAGDDLGQYTITQDFEVHREFSKKDWIYPVVKDYPDTENWNPKFTMLSGHRVFAIDAPGFPKNIKADSFVEIKNVTTNLRRNGTIVKTAEWAIKLTMVNHRITYANFFDHHISLGQ